MNYRTQPLLTAKEQLELHRSEVFGPKPVNVFTRLRAENNLKLVDATRVMHISKQALIRLEQGTFNEPLPTVVDFWVKKHGYNELSLREEYDEFRRLTRLRHRRLFGDNLSTGTPGEHPLRQLRSRINFNNSELSKALCIPQATLQHFERHWKRQQSVPKELQLALHDVGYTNLQIQDLVANYILWRRYQLGNGQGLTNGQGG